MKSLIKSAFLVVLLTFCLAEAASAAAKGERQAGDGDESAELPEPVESVEDSEA